MAGHHFSRAATESASHWLQAIYVVTTRGRTWPDVTARPPATASAPRPVGTTGAAAAVPAGDVGRRRTRPAGNDPDRRPDTRAQPLVLHRYRLHARHDTVHSSNKQGESASAGQHCKCGASQHTRECCHPHRPRVDCHASDHGAPICHRLTPGAAVRYHHAAEIRGRRMAGAAEKSRTAQAASRRRVPEPTDRQ